jgi:hypothetical protein
MPSVPVQIRLQLLVDVSTAESDQESGWRYLVCAKFDSRLWHHFDNIQAIACEN